MKAYSFSNLAVHPFPTLADLNNPWIFGCVQVLINVSGHEYPEDVFKAIEAKGIRWYHFPLVEEGPDMGLENILAAVRELMKADEAGEKVILHCSFGNNRSRTVAEAFHFKKRDFSWRMNTRDIPIIWRTTVEKGICRRWRKWSSLL